MINYLYGAHNKFLINIFEIIIKCNHCNDDFFFFFKSRRVKCEHQNGVKGKTKVEETC